MYTLHKIKSCYLAAFSHFKEVKKEDFKNLKICYAITLVITSNMIKTSSVVLILMNLSIDIIVTYLKFKFIPSKKTIDLTFLEGTEQQKVIEGNIIVDTLDFDKVLDEVPHEMELPFLLGYGRNGQHIFADLIKFLHTLIAGTTGKGKSNFINQFIQSLMLYGKGNLALFLCDMKKIELADYKEFINCRYFSDPEVLLKVLIGLREEMQTRYRKFMDIIPGQKAFKNLADYNLDTHEDLCYSLLLIDEFGDINDIDDEYLKESIWKEIRWILREGRAAGIIIVLATQRPTKENIIPSVKNLMASFIGFGVRDGNEASYCGVKGSCGLNIGEIIVNSEGFDNEKLKTYHIKPHDGIYYKLYDELKERR
jgi:hypothetical protein